MQQPKLAHILVVIIAGVSYCCFLPISEIYPHQNLSPEEDPTSDIYIKKQDIFKENKKMKKQARSELGKRGNPLSDRKLP